MFRASICVLREHTCLSSRKIAVIVVIVIFVVFLVHLLFGQRIALNSMTLSYPTSRVNKMDIRRMSVLPGRRGSRKGGKEKRRILSRVFWKRVNERLRE